MSRAVVALAVLLNTALNTSAQSPKLMLFGGDNHKTYLGCLNCNRYAADSVCNKFGSSGNRFSGDSIWNRFGTYGNRFAGGSPWNSYGTDPPIIVDSDGQSYGYFTKNTANPNRTRIKVFVQLLNLVGDIELDEARDLFCDGSR